MIGGYSTANGLTQLTSIESFDLRANKWCASSLEDPLGPRRGLRAAVIEAQDYSGG